MNSFNRIVLVDFSWTYHKSWYTNGDLSFVTKDKVWKTGGMFGCINSVKYLRNRYNCPIIIVTEPKKNTRYKLDETYKAGRSKKDPAMYDLWEDTLSALSLIPNVPIITSNEEWESDDVLYSFVKKNANKFDEFLISGTDNDYLQISSIPELRNKVFYCPRSSKDTDNILMVNYCQEKYQIDISKILLYRSVFGDSSDNLPAIAPRIQKKFVREWMSKENVVDIKSFIAEVWLHRENPNAEKIIHAQKAMEHNFNMMRLREISLKKADIEKKVLDYFVENFGLHSLVETVNGG